MRSIPYGRGFVGGSRCHSPWGEFMTDVWLNGHENKQLLKFCLYIQTDASLNTGQIHFVLLLVIKNPEANNWLKY